MYGSIAPFWGILTSPSSGALPRRILERQVGFLFHQDLSIQVLPDDTPLEDLALPLAVLARLDLIGVHTIAQFRVLMRMRDKTRSQLVTTLRRASRQKTKRPGLE